MPAMHLFCAFLHRLSVSSNGHHPNHSSRLSWTNPQQEGNILFSTSRRIVYVINFLLQAAAALAAFTLESPTKPSRKEAVVLIDDEKRSPSPESVTDATDTLPDFRRKFVGEVDLPES